MKRSKRRAYTRDIAKDLEKKTYAYWAAQQFPIFFERIVEGEKVEVEVCLLEFNEEYIQLGVRVYDDNLLSKIGCVVGLRLVVGNTAVIRKTPGK